MRKNLKISVLLATLFFILISINVLGITKRNSIKILPPIKDVPFNKQLIVMFDDILDEIYVNNNNVYVIDYKNSKHPISISLGNDKKSIIVSPVKAYEYGKTYTLFISKNLRYKNGKCTNVTIKRQFTISKDIESKELPTIESDEKLLTLFKECEKNYSYLLNIKKDINYSTEKSAADNVEMKNLNSEYSKTNIQVEGVDEGDRVKTDGNYIYEIANNKVYIIKAYPAENMSVESVLTYDRFNPNEIYVDGNYIVIIGTSFLDIPVIKDYEKGFMPPYYYNYSFIKALVFDIADRKNPKLQREYEIEGSLVSSRKIGNIIYLISNKYQYYYDIQKGEKITPLYKDTAIDSNLKNIEYNKIRYFPQFVKPCFLTISGIDINNSKKPVQISSYLGAGEEIFATDKNLYVAVTNYIYNYKNNQVQEGLINSYYNTLIYKFGFNEGKTNFIAKASVPGSILNQFSMDEYNTFFRVATTSGFEWGNDDNISKTNIYVFDDKMNLKGKIEGMAPNERIYSVRFMGDKGYVVTFRTVDPLFVIDLKDPTKPKILGELKISGYSNYIHPYDENHIIGFGKETIEKEQKDERGNVIGTIALNMGMKMAVFDITDVKNPKAIYIEKIGDRGTDSEILYNHKALLFSKMKGIIAFPITVMNVEDENDTTSYGKFTFQGAYIYNFSLSNGFKLKGKITHLSDEDYKDNGYYWYNSNKNINRILYIENNIYTISDNIIKAHNIADLKEINQIETK